MSRTIQLNKFQTVLNDELEKIADLPCTWTEDVQGNRFGWLHLPDPMHLLSAAAVMHTHKARLLTITAFAEERDDQDKKRSIAYHFVLQGCVVTITIRIYDPNTFEKLPVPSISSLFRNADWNEREFHEMFDIDIINHPNPKRLFLDERLDAGIMSSLIPFSTMSNGMSSQGLWEKVMEEKAGYTPALHGCENNDGSELEAAPEGKVTTGSKASLSFTPVSETAHMTAGMGEAQTEGIAGSAVASFGETTVQSQANNKAGHVGTQTAGQATGQTTTQTTGQTTTQAVTQGIEQAADK